jgi:hypothetical protein
MISGNGRTLKEPRCMTGKYEDTGAKIGRIVAGKNIAYGNSFSESGEILKLLYPNGVKQGEYKTLLAVTRIIDKLFRIATDERALDEDPWKDIAGYAILMVRQKEDVKK